MDVQRKDHIVSKRPSNGNCYKQLQTHNVPTYDVENTNGTNKERSIFNKQAADCSLGNWKSAIRYSGPFLKWNREQTNGQENKKTNDHA